MNHFSNLEFRKKYILILIVISGAISILIHLPEIVDLLTNDNKGHITVFDNMLPLELLNEVIFAFISILFLFWLNAVIFRFNDISAKIGIKKLFLSFILCWVVSALLSNLFYVLHENLDIVAVEATAHHYLHPIRDFIISLIITGTNYIVHLILRQQKIIVENQQLKLDNILGQYESLKNQLNPHMLFNSLNTLQSVIRENQDKAIEYISELSLVLRYMLQKDASDKSTLEEELKFVNSYIYILSMRFGDNLIFRFNIDSNLKQYFLPPISLQMLVENAVKHNEISNKKPLLVNIVAENNILKVCNNIQPKRTKPEGMGIGLNNLTKRYSLLFGKKIEIDSQNNMFCVSIPLINSKDLKS